MSTVRARLEMLASIHDGHLDPQDEEWVGEMLDGVEKEMPSACTEMLQAIGMEDLHLWKPEDSEWGTWMLYGGESFEVNLDDSIWGGVSMVCVGQSSGSLGSADILFVDATGALGEAGGVYVSSNGHDDCVCLGEGDVVDYLVRPLAPSLESFLQAAVALPAGSSVGPSGDALCSALGLV